MKKYLKISALCLCLTVFAACEVEFDFRNLDEDPLFLLDGNIIADLSSSGSASFQMYLYAVPSAAGNREFSEEARCTLKVYRNSELIDVKDYITIESFYGLIADEYAVSPGDEVTVTAESDGFLTASASTVIPENPPAVEIACSRDGDNLDVRFSFGDNAGTDDAYAFSFRTLASDGKPGDNDPGNLVELPYGDLGSPVIDNGPFDVVWEDGYSYYCIRDDSFNGGRKEIELTFTSFPFSSDMTSYFRIEVRHVSPERILYETAVADKASNILGFVGLAPCSGHLRLYQCIRRLRLFLRSEHSLYGLGGDTGLADIWLQPYSV